MDIGAPIWGTTNSTGGLVREVQKYMIYYISWKKKTHLHLLFVSKEEMCSK